MINPTSLPGVHYTERWPHAVHGCTALS